MERLLKPKVFETLSDAPDAAKQWKYFFRCFQNFLAALDGDPEDQNRLQLLINHISPDIYAFIDECLTYEQAIAVLKRLYVKTPNTVFARHLLAGVPPGQICGGGRKLNLSPPSGGGEFWFPGGGVGGVRARSARNFFSKLPPHFLKVIYYFF